MVQRRKSGQARKSIRKSRFETLEKRQVLSGISLTAIGSFETGVFDESAAEIVAHDPTSQRVFFTNSDADSVVVLDVTDPTQPTEIHAIDVSTIYINGQQVATGGVNSVAVNDGIVAVALENENALLDGYVGFYGIDGEFRGSVTVGTLPDMLTFSPDGTKIVVANEGEPSDAGRAPSMATGENGFQVEAVFTIGETFTDTTGALNALTAGDYTPPGVLDGLGAMAHPSDPTRVRVFANHELLNFRGYEYQVPDGSGGSFVMTGARISYFDLEKETRQVVDAGIAYNAIYDANGDRVTSFTNDLDPSANDNFLANDFAGFSRFCSSVLVEAHQFGNGRGLEDPIYFSGEEDGGFFNGVGGAEWALDVTTGDLWQVPDMGRGAWENITEVDTGTTTHVAFILADDSSPFNFDQSSDGSSEPVPLYLYIGQKNASGDFLERNGLRDGNLYVWVSETGERTPTDFNTNGTLSGKWVEIDNSPVADVALRSDTGDFGFDEYGYPTQSNLVTQAHAKGAFGFSRPEDVAVNPDDGTEIVLASTGVDTFEVDPVTGNGVDSFGTIYTVKTDFTDLSNPTATMTIIYDGDADPTRSLRSPDNLDWADDGKIYIQEDEAEEDTLSGDEVLFGEGAVNPKEAGILQLDPISGELTRVATIDRSVVLDPTTESTPFDLDAGAAGEWETSGILDVSTLFDETPGSLFLFDIQAHGIEDQSTKSRGSFGPNADSLMKDTGPGALVEGGQLAFLMRNEISNQDPQGSVSIIDVSSGPELATVETATFTKFDGMEDDLREQGVRLFPGKSVSQDVEPEYVAVAPDGLKAMITLQEANAFAVLDLETSEIIEIVPLGLKDHSLPGNGLDASDRDDAINIRNWPLYGMYMPDAVTSYEAGGETFYITANEGDDRGDADEDPWGDAVRLKDIGDPLSFNRGGGLSLDASLSEDLLSDENLGRLAISSIDGDLDGDGDLDQLHSYGTRSFSIWDSQGMLVFDSGDQIEQITASTFPDNFNASNDENDAEGRSDNKGPEPEAVTTGIINGRTFAFVGLERIGGIMVYDVSDPLNPTFQQYINNRDFFAEPGAEDGNPLDLGVEDLKFISAEDSPNGAPLIVSSNEVSGSVSIFQISGSVLNEGVLELLGTEEDDSIRIRRRGFSELEVTTNFTIPSKQTFGNGEVQKIRASTFGGNDQVAASFFVGTDMVLDLGAGNDRASTGAGNDLILGGPGNDFIRAGLGDNILIGGLGRDRLTSGVFGSNLLIGGTTRFDQEATALELILSEWESPRTFRTRVANLRSGSGPFLSGSSVKLTSSGEDATVHDDGESDRMRGYGLSRDWFFADLDRQDRDDDRVIGYRWLDELNLF